MLHNYKIIFFLYKSKRNPKGQCPIYCRVTLNKKQKHFSTGFRILPDEWHTPSNSVIDNPLAEQINNHLIAIKAKAMELSLQHKMTERECTLDEFVSLLLGKKSQNLSSFLEVFKQHNIEVEALVGKSYSPATLVKFKGIYKQIEGFIKHTYQQEDAILSNIKLKFLMDLEYYLLTEKNMKQISINKTIQRVRKIIKYAIAHEYMEKDPFLLYKPKAVHLDVVFLDSEELVLVEKYNFEKDRLDKVRDCFVFCCYTGLAYNEMDSLSHEHIVKGYDGKDWIKMSRKKTGKPLMIPILPTAQAILDKYVGADRLLPKLSNQKFNKNLKEIGEILGIKKKLSHHVARKTFASTVLLYNDVPMEIVSELLGHSSMKITQKHYGKVVNKKVGQQMDELSKRLDKE